MQSTANFSSFSFERSWRRAWRALNAQGNELTPMQSLIARYDEPHRAYHTTQHLRECLVLLESVKGNANEAAEIEMALWFHDAIYDVHSKTNEADSATLAHETLSAAKVSQHHIDAIIDLIMQTQHTASPSEPDAQLLVDIDLSILGAPRERFDEYERQIREEYKHVPDDLFFVKRKEILRSFLNRARIYSTEHFHNALESMARANLSRTVGDCPRFQNRSDLPK